MSPVLVAHQCRRGGALRVSQLKTIYDALSAQNLNGGGRPRESVGLGATLMNGVYVLITWFGLGIATMSQPLGTLSGFFAPPACCRRVFRRSQAIEAEAAAAATAPMHPNGALLSDPHPSPSLASFSSSNGVPAPPFLPTVHHHHASERDRYTGSTVSSTRTKLDRDRERERERDRTTRPRVQAPRASVNRLRRSIPSQPRRSRH